MDDSVDALVPEKRCQPIRFTEIDDAKETFRNGLLMSSEHVVRDYHRVTYLLEKISRMRADVTGPAGDQNFSQAFPSVTND